VAQFETDADLLAAVAGHLRGLMEDTDVRPSLDAIGSTVQFDHKNPDATVTATFRPGPGSKSPVRGSRASPVSTGRPAALHARQPPSRTRTSGWPWWRSSHQQRAAARPDQSS
jgi:hypothetical protein